MHHSLRTKNKSEAGQSLIIVALLMVGMIGALGLALDGGNVFASRRKSQNAADAAAFAGVRLLATKSVTATEANIWTAITTLSAANGVTSPTDVTAWFIDSHANNICVISQCGGGAPPANATGVRVTTRLQMQPYFIDVLIGKNKIPIQAIAAAQSGPPSIVSDLMPMTVHFPCPWPPSDPPDPSCNIHYDNPPVPILGVPQMPGGFQWTSYDCDGSTPDLEGYLRLTKPRVSVMADPADDYYNQYNPTQYNNMPPPSPWVCSSSGFSSGARDALDCWIDTTGSRCWTSVPYPGNRYWTVPVFNHDNSQTGAGAKYHIAMFAQFEFLGYWFENGQYNYVGKSQGASFPSQLQYCADQRQKCVMGRFIKQVVGTELHPGKCNTMGLDICAVGMSQ